MDESKEWVIVGAGPAGIAVISRLLDAGLPAKKILWIDPEFIVGELGQKWKHVLGNTPVKLFLEFLNSSASFLYKECPINFEINNLPLEGICELRHLVDPLQWITDHLSKKVTILKTMVTEVKQCNHQWVISTSAKERIYADNVVLATGVDPKQLSYERPVISVPQAMSLSLLKKQCNAGDIVGVFGSSHTAIVAMYNLIDAGAQKVINFYRSPLKYSLSQGDYILFDNTGLKGYSAKWARTYLEGNGILPNLERTHISSADFEEKLKICNKIVYAIGFERKKLPMIVPYTDVLYDHSTGIIASGLFGIGIAYPQWKYDKLGIGEYYIGVWDFAKYLDQVFDIWLMYKK